MNIDLTNLIKFFTRKTRTIFLVDGLGAAMTTFYLFFVLRRFSDYFGMPPHILTYLSLIGLILCVYSLTCFFFLKDNWIPFLRLISIGNLLYCFLTAVLVFNYYSELTKLGLMYFMLEMAIILIIVHVEFSVATILKRAERLMSYK